MTHGPRAGIANADGRPALERAVDAALGLSTLAFLVVGDIWFPPGSPWHVVRMPVLLAALASAAVVIARAPGLVRTLARPPLVFFTAFAAIDLVASAAGARPMASLRYAVGYVAIAGLALALASRFDRGRLVRGLLAALIAKVVLSLAVATMSIAWWWGLRFQGVLGSPNPMGAAAALCYLLVVLDAWHRWPRRATRLAMIAVALAATCAVAVAQSLSALVAASATLVLLAPLSRVRRATWRDRFEWLVVSLALLAPLLFTGGGTTPDRLTTPAQSVSFRSGWWVMLVAAIGRHPWLGYGAGSTSWLAIAGSAYTSTSAHNLYLEAALFAGVPAALLMLAFIVTTCAAAAKAAARDDADGVGLAVPVFVYAVLSLVEPVVLNGVPSSLVVPLTVAAVCSIGGGKVATDADR